MTHPAFLEWWERAKLSDEFRGHTLAAAYAAWLAGADYALSHPDASSSVTADSAVQTMTATADGTNGETLPKPKRTGKYRGGGSSNVEEK